MGHKATTSSPIYSSLCSTLCQTLSEFYLGELSHNSLIWQEADWSVCFCLMVSPHIFVEKACFDKGRIVGHMIEWSFGFSCWKYVAAYGLLNRRVIFSFLLFTQKILYSFCSPHDVREAVLQQEVSGKPNILVSRSHSLCSWGMDPGN